MCRRFESHYRYHIWLVGQAVKTPPFHGGNTGSNPVRVTKKDDSKESSFFIHCESNGISSTIALLSLYLIGPIGLYIITPLGVYQPNFRNDDMLVKSEHSSLLTDDIQFFAELVIYNGFAVDLFAKMYYNSFYGNVDMAKNYLLIYSEQLATEIETLCNKIKAPSNTLFQIRKSSSSVYANICEANYGQSKADMLSKLEIALKECSETEGWLQLLFNTNAIDEATYKNRRNLCGRIRRMLIASCKTLKENSR